MSNSDFYQPSPDEIAAACLRIQATWSASERHSRQGKTPPMIACDFVGITAEAEVRAEDRLAARREAMAAMKA